MFFILVQVQRHRWLWKSYYPARVLALVLVKSERTLSLLQINSLILWSAKQTCILEVPTRSRIVQPTFVGIMESVNICIYQKLRGRWKWQWINVSVTKTNRSKDCFQSASSEPLPTSFGPDTLKKGMDVPNLPVPVACQLFFLSILVIPYLRQSSCYRFMLFVTRWAQPKVLWTKCQRSYLNIVCLDVNTQFCRRVRRSSNVDQLEWTDCLWKAEAFPSISEGGSP